MSPIPRAKTSRMGVAWDVGRLQTRGGSHHIRQMCGRYASFLPAEALAHLFGTAGPLPNLEPTWNMAPTKAAPIVRFDREAGERRLEVVNGVWCRSSRRT